MSDVLRDSPKSGTASRIRWQDIAPKDAVDIDLTVRTDITAPLNEVGKRCPWPWEPQQLGGAPLGQFHCPYCLAMCVAGVEHLDYGVADGECYYACDYPNSGQHDPACKPPTMEGHPT